MSINKANIIPRNYLSFNEFFEVNVRGDGNCFFRCLSKHIDKTENNYPYYRKIIYEYTKNNKEILKYFFYQLENENDNEYNKRYDNFIENIKNDKTFAINFEISAASVVLKRGIIIYKKEPNGYNLINIYSADKNNDLENIFIVYVNNNHFNLIVQKDTNIHPYIDNNNIQKIHEKIEKDNKIKKNRY